MAGITFSGAAGVNASEPVLPGQQQALRDLTDLRAQLVKSDGSIRSGYLSLQSSGKEFSLTNKSLFSLTGDKQKAATFVNKLVHEAYGNEIGRMDKLSRDHLESAIDTYLTKREGKLGTASFVKLIDTLESLRVSGSSTPARSSGSITIQASRLNLREQALTGGEQSALNDYLGNRGAYQISNKEGSVVAAPSNSQPVNQPEARSDQVKQRETREFIAELVSPSNLAGVDDVSRLVDVLADSSHRELLAELANNPDQLNEAGVPRDLSDAFKNFLDVEIVPADGEAQRMCVKDYLKDKHAIPPLNDNVLNSLADAINSTVENFNTEFVGAQLTLQNPGSPKHAFLKEVFEDYYQKSDLQDKKAMLASVLRECAAEADPNAPPAAKETLQRQQLMGLIKGAGPFFQKYIQQHSEDFENPEVKKLLATVKRGLAHIPEDLRNANLAEIIKNSGKVKGQAIKGISEVQSLGAASIGEALKMKLTYEDSDKEPEVVVIKMLRPGIAQRASRENLVLKEIAESGGNDAITESYADHASSVEEEMLFRKEYENIKKAGEIFNKGAGTNKPYSTVIRAGEVHPAAVGSDRTIMMKLAAGKPMSDHIDALEREGIQDTPEGIARIVNMAKKLQDAYLSMSQSFFRGAVAGSGFFHGDLHSGNVMYDNAEGADLLTEIDWGNAHTLTDVQQKSISRTFAGLVSGDFNFIFDSLQTQLSEEDQRKLASIPEGQQKTVRELVIEAIRDDLPQGSDPPTAVQRLRNSGRALNKIVDKLNGYEISMPSSFIRLVKSQQMLENDINRLQSVINTQLSAEPHAEALKAAEAEKELCEQELMRQLPPLADKKKWGKLLSRVGIKAEFLSDRGPGSSGLADAVRKVLRENLPEDKVDQWADALAEAGAKYSRIKNAATTARTERVGLIRQANLPDGVGKERTFYGVVYPALGSDLLRAAALLGAGGLDKMSTSGLTPDLMQ